MALDQRTVQRMQELFGNRACCVCGGPAKRVIEDRFLCAGHFLSARRSPKRKRGLAVEAQECPVEMGSQDERHPGEQPATVPSAMVLDGVVPSQDGTPA